MKYFFIIINLILTSTYGFCQIGTGIGSGSNLSSGVLCFWNTDWSDDCLDEINSCTGCEFFIEEGKLMYGDPDNSCSAQEIYCASLCPIYEYDWQNVIEASASTFSNQITMDGSVQIAYGVDGLLENTVETGETGKWYLQTKHVYKTDLTNEDLSFESGTFEDFYPFNWSNTNQVSSHWLLTDTNTYFSPNGHTLETENVLGIKNAEKYGYNNSLVYIAANNASYESVLFESFEINYGSSRCGDAYCFEELGFDNTGYDAHEYTNDYAHAGEYSVKINMDASSTSSTGSGFAISYTKTNTGYLELGSSHSITTDILNSGLLVKLWVRYTGTSTLTMSLQDLTLTVTDGGGDVISSEDPLFNDVSFEAIARSGEWQLYQAEIKPEDWLLTTGDYRLRISFATSSKSTVTFGSGTSSSPAIYVDDLRVQPLNSKMIAYVYDPASYRMITEFDDQNFGMYYQYNDEGKLTRKMKETIRGIKTLSETEYHIPESSR